MTYAGLLGYREVAGLRTVGGGRVRPRLLFRSGTPQFLTPGDAAALVTDTGIRTLLDLRLPHEVQREGRGPLADLPVRHVPNPFTIRTLLTPGSAVAPMTGDDAVWEVGGDVGNIADWIPAIERSHMVGDVRHATFAGGGGDATERVVERDDTARDYDYEYLTGPLPLEFYRSRFAVHEHPDGAKVVWSAEFRAGSAEDEAGLAEGHRRDLRGGAGEAERPADDRVTDPVAAPAPS